jgi:mannose-6-phosphate isomerase-like protein (cupin superfamily)
MTRACIRMMTDTRRRWEGVSSWRYLSRCYQVIPIKKHRSIAQFTTSTEKRMKKLEEHHDWTIAKIATSRFELLEDENVEDRVKHITTILTQQYPGKIIIDLNGNGLHIICEIEPTQDHTEYDRAIEVIIASKPHKHMITTQHYTIISWNLQLHIDDSIITLHPWDQYMINPWLVHRASSTNECIVETYSAPWWTAEDHISSISD